MGVVEGRTQALAARQILECGRYAPFHMHGFSAQRHAVGKARQRGAVGAQQEYGFQQITGGLFDRQSGELFVKQRRSEEHTSELQSLMRISYAVFCLKKKKKKKQVKTHKRRKH